MLESFPESILEIIFDHLTSQDLLNLCWISRDFKNLATACLYKKIVVCDKPREPSKAKLVNWLSDDYTMTSDLEKLSHTLKNNSALAARVKSLSINLQGNQTGASLLDLCSDLKEYQNAGLVRKVCFSGIPKISCRVVCLPTFDTNLTELRLRFTENTSEGERFEKITEHMIRNNVHANLKVLALESSEPDSYGASLNLVGADRNRIASLSNPPWVLFFERFARQSAILNLTTLCLQGFSKRPELILMTIGQCVQLPTLETVELTINEVSHHSEDHSSQNLYPTFLVLFSKFLPNVVNFHISYSSSCFDCESRDVMRSLIFQENNLKTLQIWLRNPDIGTVMRLHGTIMFKQRNLISLDYSHHAQPVHDDFEDLAVQRDVFRICKQHQIYELIKHHYTPEFVFPEESSMKTSVENQNWLVDLAHIERAQVVGHILERDVIYVLAKEMMPHLVKYHRHGLDIDVKTEAMIINGQWYRLPSLPDNTRRQKTCDLFEEFYVIPLSESNDDDGFFV